MSARQRKQKEPKSRKSKITAEEVKEEPREQDEEGIRNSTLWKKVFTRVLLSSLMIFVVYWTSNKNNDISILASQKDQHKLINQDVPCSKSYKDEVSKFKGCVPEKCGRFVTDIIVTSEEAAHLLQIAKKGLTFGGSGGGASILDLHSGALSQGSQFVNVYKKIKAAGKNKVFTEQDFKIYSNVRHKIQHMIAYSFGIDFSKLYLTHPTFFSEMTSRASRTVHDEYWHVHIDKDTYPAFHYTSLLYLTDHGQDFTGGRFMFVGNPANVSVEPKFGRVSAFTSGAENPHFVEKVTSGTRYALTVSFTCDKNYAIEDPSIDKLS